MFKNKFIDMHFIYIYQSLTMQQLPVFMSTNLNFNVEHHLNYEPNYTKPKHINDSPNLITIYQCISRLYLNTALLNHSFNPPTYT